MVSTSLAFSVWQACSALQTALILIWYDTKHYHNHILVLWKSAYIPESVHPGCICSASVSLGVFVIVHFTSQSRSLISSQGYTCPWHFTDCEEAFSPAGTKNSCKYRNEILIMDHAKTTTTTTTKTTKTNKQTNKQTSKKLK